MATSDGGKTIITAPAAHKAIVLTKLVAIVRTAAAQAVTIRDSTSAITIYVIAASTAAGTAIIIVDNDDDGIPLPVGANLVAANTAGPAVDFNWEAYTEHYGLTAGSQPT